jgi:hypothetical protein
MQIVAGVWVESSRRPHNEIYVPFIDYTQKDALA